MSISFSSRLGSLRGRFGSGQVYWVVVCIAPFDGLLSGIRSELSLSAVHLHLWSVLVACSHLVHPFDWVVTTAAQEAAKQLGIGLSVLKRVCREKGLVRWPFRKRKSLNNVMQQTKTFLVRCSARTRQQVEYILAWAAVRPVMACVGEHLDRADDVTGWRRGPCCSHTSQISYVGATRVGTDVPISRFFN